MSETTVVPRPEWAIDLEKVLAQKFPNKKFPKWLVRRLKRFIHEDMLNDIISSGYEGTDLCKYAMQRLDIHLEAEGLENVVLPEGARMLFTSNHPLGGADGLANVSVIADHFDSNIRLLVNDFLMFIKGLASISVPVNKTGGQTRELPRMLKEVYGSDATLMIFPAGLCSRRINGKVQDLPWTKDFIKRSRETGRWVIPMHFYGQNSNKFYTIANISKLFKLKFNLAMLWLPDELYRAQHKTFKIKFGTPIPPETFDKSKTDLEWAAWVREKVYEL